MEPQNREMTERKKGMQGCHDGREGDSKEGCDKRGSMQHALLHAKTRWGHKREKRYRNAKPLIKGSLFSEANCTRELSVRGVDGWGLRCSF